MKSNRPLETEGTLQPIRRAAPGSVSTFKDQIPRESSDCPDDKRNFRFESLEDRRVLSANGTESELVSDTFNLRIWQKAQEN